MKDAPSAAEPQGRHPYNPVWKGAGLQRGNDIPSARPATRAERGFVLGFVESGVPGRHGPRKIISAVERSLDRAIDSRLGDPMRG